MKNDHDNNRITPITAFLFGAGWGLHYAVAGVQNFNNNYRARYSSDLPDQIINGHLWFGLLVGLFLGCITYAIFRRLQRTKFAPRPIVVRIAGFTVFTVACLRTVFFLVQSGYV